jgi:type II secretory pathway component PulM
MLPVATPALPLDEAGKYIAGAYIVFVLLILIYVVIMAAKLQRIERELTELASFAEQRNSRDGDPRNVNPARDSDTPGREAEEVAGNV